MSEETREQVYQIDPFTIKIRKGWNCRNFNDPANKAHVEELADSIASVGVKEPLTVVMEDSKPVLINGESRLRAIKLLKKRGTVVPTVPVRVAPSDISEEDKLSDQVVRNSGRPFTPLEHCAVFRRLRDLGWDDRQIAEHVGMKIERVRQIMHLENTSEKVRKHIRAGKISATTVQRIVTDEDGGVEAVEDRVEGALKRAKADGKDVAGPRHVPPRIRPDEEPVEPAEHRDEVQTSLALPPGKDEQLRISAKSLLTTFLSHQEGTVSGKGETVSVRFKVPRELWERVNKATY